jgi:kynurenine formamidase
MITYRGLPGPVITDHLTRDASRAHYAEGTTFHIGRIDMVANTGTYLDAPFHRHAEGKDLAELPLESLADLEGVVFHADPGAGALGPELFTGADLANKAVLVHTGWSRHWGTDRYFEGHPYLTATAARHLASARPALVGIDSLNIDATTDGARPAHTVLLAADIPIVEHMANLDRLPDNGFRFHAVPVKVKRFGTFPVRAYAVVEGGTHGG